MNRTVAFALRGTVIVVIALAGAGMVDTAAETLHALAHGRAPGPLVLRIGLPGQLVPLVVFGFMMTVEILLSGWRRSTARDLLGEARSARLDLWCWLMSVTGLMSVAIAVATLGALGGLPAMTSGWRADALPSWVALPAALLLMSFQGYWVHRLFHTRPLWRLHTFHHSAEELTLATAHRTHPVELAVRLAVQTGVSDTLGFAPGVAAASLVILYAVSLYEHSSIPGLDFLERWVCLGPGGHRVHHSTDPGHHHANFGNLVLWDRLFGTYVAAPAGPIAVGLTDAEAAHARRHPLMAMVAVQIEWMAELLEAGHRGLSLACARRPR